MALEPSPMPQGPPSALADTDGVRQGVRNNGNQKRMISELERINALNLEPSISKKADDGQRLDKKYWQDRGKVKNEFEQFLAVMKKNDETKSGGGDSSRANEAAGTQGGFASTGASNLALPNSAATQSPSNPSTPFPVECTALSFSLPNILEDMLTKASAANANDLPPSWPEARGPSYHEVLGRATGKTPIMKAMGQEEMPDYQNRGRLEDAPHHGGNMRQQPTVMDQPLALEDNRTQGRSRQGGQMGHNSRQNQHGNDQGQMRSNFPQGNQGMQQQQQSMRDAGPQGGPQGYVMQGPGGMQQGVGGQQPQMMFQMPGGMGPGGQPMQGMQGMNMQGQQMMYGRNGQMIGMMPGNGQMMPMGMMQGGQNSQGGNMQQFSGDQQQQQHQNQQQPQNQQMMFMPVMMPADQAQGGGYMQPQGMPGGYPQPGNNQQGYMMAPGQVYQPQASNGG